MVSQKLAIELASRNDDWDQWDAATKSATAIAEEISDRRGFDLGTLDEILQDEIIDSWATIIRTIHKEEMG